MRSALLAALLTLACCALAPEDDHIEVDLQLPDHFPAPMAPVDNPLTRSSIELGQHLFYDARLSVNQSRSCSSCHKQELAFADDVPTSMGATEEFGVLNTPGLANVIYASPLTWSHGRIAQIEEQLLGPMFGDAPVEMGMRGAESEILARLAAEPRYQALFAAAYPGHEISLELVRFALASFVRSLVSSRAPFDRFVQGDANAISPGALQGSELFYSARLGCSTCHAGFQFTTAVRSAAASSQPTSFHNIGLYDIDGQGGYPPEAPGLIAESGLASDMGRFRVPSLRNVALTGPYGHDGSVASLEDFIRIYEDGGRELREGESAGDGRQSPLRSDHLQRFELSDSERADLIAFLESLSDVEFTGDPRHANPWPSTPAW